MLYELYSARKEPVILVGGSMFGNIPTSELAHLMVDGTDAVTKDER